MHKPFISQKQLVVKLFSRTIIRFKTIIEIIPYLGYYEDNQQQETMNSLNLDFPEKSFFIDLFGADIYAVGGCVRDLYRRVPIREYDLLIAHHEEKDVVKALQSHGKVNLVGKSFGVIKFTIKGRTFDIALPRKDAPRENKKRGHKDFFITTDPDIPLEQDLARRDFRCNSMAMGLKKQALIDPFNGLKDIQQKKLNLTDPQAFPDDPLRILRAARFAAVLEFSVEPAVYNTAKDVDLSALSVERVTEELFKILLNAARPSVGLEELFQLDALRQLFPELYQLTLSIQDSRFHPEKDRFGHHSVWQHTKITVDQAKRLAEKQALSQQEQLALLMAALYHDTGKPDTARWEYKRGHMSITNNRHDIQGEEITRQAMDRLKIFSWGEYDLRRTTLALIRCHHRVSELWQNRKIVTKKAFNRLAADVNGEIMLLIYLDAADRAGRDEKPITNLDQEAEWIINKFDELNVTKETIKPLIQGRDLIEMGVKPGPNMGKILKRLYQLQLDNEYETRESGLVFAENLIKQEDQ